jgi:hypothetical protein
MTANDNGRSRLGRVRTGRRRLLAGIGASGLTAAVATFTRATPALAADQGCCHLAHPPGDPNNVSYSWCQAHATYIWNCHLGTRDCACCETAHNAQSASVCVRAG